MKKIVKKIIRCSLLVVYGFVAVSCSTVEGVITPIIFESVDAVTDVKGEIVVSGTFYGEYVDRKSINIEQKLPSQIRYILTSFGTSKCTVEFLHLKLTDIDMDMIMWFSKSSDSGYDTRFRLYKNDGLSELYLQLDSPHIEMTQIKSSEAYTPENQGYMQKVVYFVAEEDHTFIFSDYSESDVVVHKNSYLKFSNYEYGTKNSEM